LDSFGNNYCWIYFIQIYHLMRNIIKQFFKRMPSFTEIVVISGVVVLLSMICETGVLGTIIATLVVVIIIRTTGKLY